MVVMTPLPSGELGEPLGKRQKLGPAQRMVNITEVLSQCILDAPLLQFLIPCPTMPYAPQSHPAVDCGITVEVQANLLGEEGCSGICSALV